MTAAQILVLHVLDAVAALVGLSPAVKVFTGMAVYNFVAQSNRVRRRETLLHIGKSHPASVQLNKRIASLQGSLLKPVLSMKRSGKVRSVGEICGFKYLTAASQDGGADASTALKYRVVGK